MMTPLRLRTVLAIALAVTLTAAAEDGKSLRNRAGNQKVSLRGTAITDRDTITRIMGIDLGEGYVLVNIQVTPEIPEGLYVSPGDFTLISRKDGERGSAMSPNEIAGAGGLVVSSARSTGGGVGVQQPGLGGQLPGGTPGGIGVGGGVQSGVADVHQAQRTTKVDPRLVPLEQKILPEGPTKDTVEGLLYFYMEGKEEPKKLGLIYDGQGGRLVIDFCGDKTGNTNKGC